MGNRIDSNTNHEKRREPRHSLNTDMTIQVVRTGEALAGTTQDVSSSGVHLMLDQLGDLKVGDEVVCEVSIPYAAGSSEACWGRGKVVRTGESRAAIVLESGSLGPVFCQPCPCCGGSGTVKSLPAVCDEISAEALKIAAQSTSASLTLRVHPEIANSLTTAESEFVKKLERSAQKGIIIQAASNLHWGQYEIS